MRNHRKKEKKDHIFSRIILQLLLIFVISTMTIVLYDMYINIEIEEDIYVPEKTTKEISIKNTEDVSTMLEEVSKTVVRNI